jgi:uncharacterized protein YlaI
MIRHGFYKTRWNAQPVRRYLCTRCQRTVSTRTFRRSYRQKRPDLNEPIFFWYSSGTTQRRMAVGLKTNRKTVVRKFLFMAQEARRMHEAKLAEGRWRAPAIQFDEMETFEHTRMKPLSIGLAVNPETYEILYTNVAPFPAKGPLAGLARKKYGFRPDLRNHARRDLIKKLRRFEPQIITTDKASAYGKPIRTFLPQTFHRQTTRKKQDRNFFHKNRRRNPNDEMFVLNFICAKLRHDLSRLMRKVWVTTKKPERLQAHLDLFTAFHNKYQFSI